ncbi:MAG: chemotaxis protein CheV [Phycisphaerae bacterium]
MAKDGILLESGTNEVEILEFHLQDQSFGVNVLKIQAIEQYDRKRVTVMPMAHPSVAGMFLFREHTIPLIDLGAELDIPQLQAQNLEDEDQQKQDQRIVLVMEFNGMTTSFVVDGVNRIHRISWEQISSLSPMIAESSAEFTGSVNIEKREILIVDIEKVVAQILPSARMDYLGDKQVEHPKQSSRPDVKIVLAEDSSAIRAMITSVLEKSGYTDLTCFGNGKDAYEKILEYKAQAEQNNCGIDKYLTLVVTDIEMPQMDGLTLCRTIKHSLGLPNLPVVMFSSLINEQTADKCRAVGADGWVSKPSINEMVAMIDSLCLEQVPGQA